MERLSYAHLYYETGKLTKKNFFKETDAAGKFFCMASDMGIPYQIPASLPVISALAVSEDFDDALEAIVRIRNKKVHPPKNHAVWRHFDEALFESWKLGLWYTELFLLRLFNYNGTYANRLTQKIAGQVENVPWAP